MAVPTLLIVTGISFSGKSVLARAIRDRLGISGVDPDEMGRELGLGWHGELLSAEQWAVIHNEAWRRAAALLSQGQSLVYDTVLFNRAQRDQLRDLARTCGAQSRLIWVDTPREVAFERWARNNLTHERPLVHRDDFDLCANEFTPPGDDEPHLMFQWSQDMDCWLVHLSELNSQGLRQTLYEP